MLIIAHRGNLSGKSDQENQLHYLLNAAKYGFGVETDINKTPCGHLTISHDVEKWTMSNDAGLILNSMISNNVFVALNIKQSGLLRDVLKIINPQHMKGFVFDFELCCNEPESEMDEYSKAGFKVAKRLSDRSKPIEYDADYIWLDEMDKTNSIDISSYDLNKIVYVSPELHRRSASQRRKEQFFGICTDYCTAL